VTKSPRLYILFHTAVPSVKPVTRYLYIGFMWLSSTELITLYSDWLNTQGLVGLNLVQTQAGLGDSLAGLRPSARRPLWAPRCNATGGPNIWAPDNCTSAGQHRDRSSALIRAPEPHTEQGMRLGTVALGGMHCQVTKSPRLYILFRIAHA